MNNYDTPWKRAIRHFFFEFLDTCWPSAYTLIDRNIAPEFLEQELPPVIPHASNGKRVADFVARVRTVTSQSVVLHIEVQHRRDRYFGERMYLYHNRLLEKLPCPVHSFAVIADDSLCWRPDRATLPQLDGSQDFHFPIFKVAGLRNSVTTMLASDNPFRFFIAIHLLNRRTRRSPRRRLGWKCKAIDRLYCHKNWSEQTIGILLSLLDWLMELPEELQDQCDGQIAVIERRYNMELMPRFAYKAMKNERRLGFELGSEKGLEMGRREGRQEGRQEGREEGREQGREQGREEGRLLGQRELLRDLLATRFGKLPENTCKLIDSAGEAELRHWARALCNASTLADVFA